MPCKIDFAENFVNKIKEIPRQKAANFIEVIGKIKNLEKPDDAGGAYQKTLWAYPVPSRSALICKIDIMGRQIHVIDMIVHL